ncbi:MAG TPA: hypothetical protein VI386_23365 [Candidatus Sulfotelmatobacter sp.]
MSQNAVRSSGLGPIVDVINVKSVRLYRQAAEWSPEQFAEEQIRGLVRQVFFSSAGQPVRQVVLSAVEGTTDVTHLCRQAGEALASEIKGSVAVLTWDSTVLEESSRDQCKPQTMRIGGAEASPTPWRDLAQRTKANLWMLTLESPAISSSWTEIYSRLCELRSEFDYSIVQGPAAGLSNQLASLGQLSDGIVLVVTAHKTRKAAARKAKETLEAARIRMLGIVLSERTFPIPTALYRRL